MEDVVFYSHNSIARRQAVSADNQNVGWVLTRQTLPDYRWNLRCLKRCLPNFSHAKAEGALVSEEPFGGLNVILAGDFHQFPLVATKPSAVLYFPCNPVKDRPRIYIAANAMKSISTCRKKCTGAHGIAERTNTAKHTAHSRIFHTEDFLGVTVPYTGRLNNRNDSPATSARQWELVNLYVLCSSYYYWVDLLPCALKSSLNHTFKSQTAHSRIPNRAFKDFYIVEFFGVYSSIMEYFRLLQY